MYSLLLVNAVLSNFKVKYFSLLIAQVLLNMETLNLTQLCFDTLQISSISNTAL